MCQMVLISCADGASDVDSTGDSLHLDVKRICCISKAPV